MNNGDLMKKKIAGYKRTRIALDVLWELAGISTYEAFAEVVKTLVVEGIMRPVTSSKLNGRSPALYNRYHLVKKAEDYSEELAWVRGLHPDLNLLGYRNRPEMVRADRLDLERLSVFLWDKQEALSLPMSINERSFQIFGREKALKDESRIKAMMKFNGMDDRSLNIYRTPEPLFDFVCRQAEEQTVLILENKDPWFTLRKIAREEGLAGRFASIDVLLYGEGKKITDSKGRLADYDQWVLGGKNVYLYFGDLDWEGIAIFLKLKAKNPDLDIQLDRDFYRAMLEEAKGISLPPMKAGQRRGDFEAFFSCFSQMERFEMVEILENGRYIPQEILGYAWFVQQMRKEA